MKKMSKKEILKKAEGLVLSFKRTQFISMVTLLVLSINPLSSTEKPEIYLGGFGMFTSAQNIGYNKNAPGVAGNFTVLSNRIGLTLAGYYSTSKKVATNEGYSSGVTLRALYRVSGKLYISSGVRLKYYTAGLWEKKAYLWTVGVKYGFPEDLIQVDISHAFKEHQTISECAITSIAFTSTVFNGRWIGFQVRSATNIINYNYGKIRKTGISGEVGIGILFQL